MSSIKQVFLIGSGLGLILAVGAFLYLNSLNSVLIRETSLNEPKIAQVDNCGLSPCVAIDLLQPDPNALDINVVHHLMETGALR